MNENVDKALDMIREVGTKVGQTVGYLVTQAVTRVTK